MIFDGAHNCVTGLCILAASEIKHFSNWGREEGRGRGVRERGRERGRVGGREGARGRERFKYYYSRHPSEYIKIAIDGMLASMSIFRCDVFS